jgi:hypothetical protein
MILIWNSWQGLFFSDVKSLVPKTEAFVYLKNTLNAPSRSYSYISHNALKKPSAELIVIYKTIFPHESFIFKLTSMREHHKIELQLDALETSINHNDHNDVKIS